MILDSIEAELGPRYSTLIDAIGWPVWNAEWRIDLTEDARYYEGRDPEQRALKQALQEDYIQDGTN